MHVNLLPFSFQRKLLIHRLVRKWTGTWLVCLLAASLFVGYRYLEIGQRRSELLEAEVQCSATRAVVASNLQLETNLAGMVAKSNDLARLNPDKDALAALAVVAQAIRASQGNAQIDNLQFHEPKSFGIAAKVTSNGAPGHPGGSITLQGVATSDEVVAGIIESVGRTPVMKKVELRSSAAFESEGMEGRRFEIVCRYGGDT